MLNYSEVLTKAVDNLSVDFFETFVSPSPGVNTFYSVKGILEKHSLEISSHVKIDGSAEIEELSVSGKGTLYIKNLTFFSLKVKLEGMVILENCRIFNECLLDCDKAEILFSRISLLDNYRTESEIFSSKINHLQGGKNKIINCYLEDTSSVLGNGIFEIVQSHIKAPSISSAENRTSVQRCIIETDNSPCEMIQDCIVKLPHNPSEKRRHYLTSEKVYVLKNVSNVVEDVHLPSGSAADFIFFQNCTRDSILVIHGVEDGKKYRLGAGFICTAIHTGEHWIIKQ